MKPSLKYLEPLTRRDCQQRRDGARVSPCDKSRHSRDAIKGPLTDEAVVARHLLPLGAGLHRIVNVERLVRLEPADGREGRQLVVDLARRLGHVPPALAPLGGLLTKVRLDRYGERAVRAVLLDLGPRSLPRRAGHCCDCERMVRCMRAGAVKRTKWKCGFPLFLFFPELEGKGALRTSRWRGGFPGVARSMRMDSRAPSRDTGGRKRVAVEGARCGRGRPGCEGRMTDEESRFGKMQTQKGRSRKQGGNARAGLAGIRRGDWQGPGRQTKPPKRIRKPAKEGSARMSWPKQGPSAGRDSSPTSFNDVVMGVDNVALRFGRPRSNFGLADRLKEEIACLLLAVLRWEANGDEGYCFWVPRHPKFGKGANNNVWARLQLHACVQTCDRASRDASYTTAKTEGRWLSAALCWPETKRNITTLTPCGIQNQTTKLRPNKRPAPPTCDIHLRGLTRGCPKRVMRGAHLPSPSAVARVSTAKVMWPHPP